VSEEPQWASAHRGSSRLRAAGGPTAAPQPLRSGAGRWGCGLPLV